MGRVIEVCVRRASGAGSCPARSLAGFIGSLRRRRVYRSGLCGACTWSAEEVIQLVGPASNIVILVANLSAEPSTSELMRAAGRVLDEADRHKGDPSLEAWAQNLIPALHLPYPWPLASQFPRRDVLTLDRNLAWQEVRGGGDISRRRRWV